jgi:ferredoxin
MGKKFVIEHDRPNCIGCGACVAVCPKRWEMNDDGKSDVKEGKDREDGWQELEIDEEEFEDNKAAADSCPVNVIHLKKKDTGEKII